MGDSKIKKSDWAAAMQRLPHPNDDVAEEEQLSASILHIRLAQVHLLAAGQIAIADRLDDVMDSLEKIMLVRSH